MVVILTIIVFSVFIYTFYNNIFTTVHNSSNTKVSCPTFLKAGFNKFKLSIIKLSFVGTVSTFVDKSSTVVPLTDAELDSLLEVVFREIGTSNQISVELLRSLGLYTSTVVNYLQSLGYIIF